MHLTAEHRRMVYQLARTEKSKHPEWSTHTCLEEAFRKCAGRGNCDESLQSMLPEYNSDQSGTIESFLEKLNN